MTRPSSGVHPMVVSTERPPCVAHNDAPDALVSVLTNPEARRAEFKRIAALGVKGIAVEMPPSDKQAVIALYEDILRDAAASHLLVTLRGSTIPRGWQRTFPNLLSMFFPALSPDSVDNRITAFE